MAKKADHPATRQFHITKPDRGGNFERWSLILDAHGTPSQVSHEYVVAAGRDTEYSWRTVICPTINSFLNGDYDSKAKDGLGKLLKGENAKRP